MIKRLLRMLGLGPDPKLQREPRPEPVIRKDRYELPDFKEHIEDLKTTVRELNFPNAVREQTLSLEMRAKIDRELSALPRGDSMLSDEQLRELTNPTIDTGLPAAYWRASNGATNND